MNKEVLQIVYDYNTFEELKVFSYKQIEKLFMLTAAFSVCFFFSEQDLEYDVTIKILLCTPETQCIL